jgi:hypothetical protein
MSQSKFSRPILGIILFPVLLALGCTLRPAYALSSFAIHRHLNTTGHATIIILDMSGSMSTNDGDGIRCSAANAYIDLSSPGDVIGVIGLDSPAPNTTGGNHGFVQALLWANPSSMDTTGQRDALKQLIAAKSHGCAPDGDTPTYDALAKALPMLSSATRDGKSGSVILLTDGVPYPDTQAQLDAINNDLVPQFVAHHWPIDTIALGTDSDFAFLKKLSDQTEGAYYSDNNGGQVTPLNIANFFVDIFALRNHRTPGPLIAPETLPGGSVERDIQVGPYVDHLDVIAIKKQAATTVTLTSPGPGGRTVPPPVPGTFVSTGDPHYAIFSINQPQQGIWHLNISGAGQFQVDSLVASSLAVAIQTPAETPTLPLGQPLEVAANVVTAQGTHAGGISFAMTGTITNNHGFTEPLALQYSAQADQYMTTLSVPVTEAPGSYEITISASQVSGVPIASARRVIQMDLFPVPQLSATGGTAVGDTAVRWDPILTAIFGLPVGFMRWLGQWSLQGIPAIPSALLSGQVFLRGQPYSEATVSATVRPVGAQNAVPASVTNLGKGRFTVQIPVLQGADYIITFKTSGTFKDNTGDFGLTTSRVHVNIRSATSEEEIIAWAITAAYALLLAYIIRFVWNLLLPPPDGRYQITAGSGSARTVSMNNQSSLFRLRRRNLVHSRQALRRPGLLMLVNYDRKGGVKVRAERSQDGQKWFKTMGQSISGGDFEPVGAVVYCPSGSWGDAHAETYNFLQKGQTGAMQEPARRRGI